MKKEEKEKYLLTGLILVCKWEDKLPIMDAKAITTRINAANTKQTIKIF